jgi:hypothetical protein
MKQQKQKVDVRYDVSLPGSLPAAAVKKARSRIVDEILSKLGRVKNDEIGFAKMTFGKWVAGGGELADPSRGKAVNPARRAVAKKPVTAKRKPK